MSIGATSTFTQSRDEICSDALVNLGAVAPGKDASEARTAGLLVHAARALNRIVKSIDADGLLLWRVSRNTNSIDSNVSTITFQPSVIDIDEPVVYFKGGGPPSTPIYEMSRDDFMAISDRTQLGTPTRYMIESTLSAITMTFDRVCDTDGSSIEYTSFTRVADFTSGADTPDFPSKWISCLVYGLTAELAPAYGQGAMMQQYLQLYNAEKARLLQDVTEHGNLTLVPFGGRRY